MSHRDHSWLLCFSTYTSTICLPQLPRSMPTLLTWQYFIHLEIGRCWKKTLSNNMTTLSGYLQTWRLKLSHAKTAMAAFHLPKREATRGLKGNNNGKILSFCPVSIYVGVKLDRALTYRHHLQALHKKLPTRISLLRRLVGSGWGAGAKALLTAALALIYSTAEYCARAWCRSAHTRLIDSVLNGALRIVTGCLRPLQQTIF